MLTGAEHLVICCSALPWLDSYHYQHSSYLYSVPFCLALSTPDSSTCTLLFLPSTQQPASAWSLQITGWICVHCSKLDQRCTNIIASNQCRLSVLDFVTQLGESGTESLGLRLPTSFLTNNTTLPLIHWTYKLNKVCDNNMLFWNERCNV